jgi:hypothetical protein
MQSSTLHPEGRGDNPNPKNSNMNQHPNEM